MDTTNSNRAYEYSPEVVSSDPEPIWSNRPWGRPTVHQAQSPVSPRLVGMVEFRYHGLRVRGVRIFGNTNGTLSVNMPQKKFGDAIESVVYFSDPVEREQFTHDVAWLFQTVFGHRVRATQGSETAQAVAV